MKILLAVDGSDYTRRMLDYVCANHALFDPSHEYVVFNTKGALPAHARSALGASTVQGFHEEEAQKVLQPALETLSQRGLAARGDWKVSPTTESVGATIAHYAEKGGFDLVIMGSHGHGALARLVMGSVTTDVLSNCKVPVLLIR